MAEKRPSGHKLMRIGLWWNFTAAFFVTALEAIGLMKAHTAELLCSSLMCLFIFIMMLDIMRRSAFVFFSDRCSGRSLILELAPCGYGADFLVKNVKIVSPWFVEALAAGGVFFIRELLSGGKTAAPFAFLTLSVFGALAALGAGMAWSCRRDFTAKRCAGSAAVFFGLFFLLFFIACAGERITQTEMALWIASLFFLSWLPRFNLCGEALCLFLSAAAAVSSFLPAARSCKIDIFEYAVPYVTASYVYDLKEEAEREAGELAASAEAERGPAETGQKKAAAGREENEVSPSAEAALERILSCGFLSLLGFAAGLGCLRLKSAEPL